MSSRATLTIPRTAHAPLAPARGSRRALEAALALGVTLSPDPRTRSAADAPIHITLGETTAILGPSGAGKSTLLRDIERVARRARIPSARAEPPELPPQRPTIDLVGADTPSAMRALARTGLADLAVFLRPPRELSTGQQTRLALAIALDALDRTAPAAAPIFLIDEFAASLDDPAARALAIALRRIARSRGLTLVVATHRRALIPYLDPTTVVTLDHAGRASTAHRPSRPRNLTITIDTGTPADYAALAHMHYRGSRPAAIIRTLIATTSSSPSPVGILTISMPLLSAAWRSLPWPGRYTSGPRTTRAGRINRELRCISRVIVDPAHRSLGIARRLVEHYLADPITPCTEAIAAMGLACPFFAAAGMTPYPLPPHPYNTRLLDLFDHAGLHPIDLAAPAAAWRAITARIPLATLERELARWSNARRRRPDESLDERFARACAVLAHQPIAYAHTAA